MYLWKPTPKSAQTTIPCVCCSRPLVAWRSCHHAFLRCEHCRKEYDLRDYIQAMDAPLENFLEAINCDRV